MTEEEIMQAIQNEWYDKSKQHSSEQIVWAGTRLTIYRAIMDVVVKEDIEWWNWKDWAEDWVLLDVIAEYEKKQFGDKPDENL